MRAPALLLAGALLLIVGCAGRGGDDSASSSGAGPVSGGWGFAQVADGLEEPVWVTHAGDGSGRLFVVEQPGRVRVVADGVLLATPFADLDALVGSVGNEQGLLSIAFHPDYETNGFVFVSYTDNAGDSVVARYRVDAADPNRIDAGSGRTILTIDQPFQNHNGGLVLFGPDGYLYLGFGDGGSGGDPAGHAQNLFSLLGKVLRIDVDGSAGYSIPPDNPFASGPQKKEIWAYGLRNPWRFSFDRQTQDLYIADVGQEEWEEVNFQPASSGGGENYGWDRYEGNHDYEVGLPIEAVFPVAEYANSAGHCSVTGGYVYRGTLVPSLEGRYVFGDYCSGQLWTLERDGGDWTLAELRKTSHLISSFGEDEGGELYLVDHGDGAVYRFGTA